MSPVDVALIGLVLAAGPAAAEQFCDYERGRASAPASRFTDNGDGTVSDKANGLQWKRCGEGQTWYGKTCAGTPATHTWEQAMEIADTASYAGNSDWRPPSAEDLRSIVERACVEPAIDLTVFPATPPGSGWWTSSPDASFVGCAWTVSFYDGHDARNSQRSGSCHVRLVRGGQ